MPTAISKPSQRDHRVDFYRGVALVMIFINHVPGNVWERYTSRNFGLSDAAELFVFLAGFASAYAYGRPFYAGTRLIASLKAWRRAGVLYLVHCTLTLMAMGLFAWAALTFGEGEFMRRMALAPLLTKPLETLIGLPALSHQFGYVNILPMYSVLLLLVPLMLMLAGINRHLLLAVSGLAWAVVGIWRIDIPAYPYAGGWFFNPLAWQFLFAIGLYCGLTKIERGRAVPFAPWLFTAAAGYLVVCLIIVDFGIWSWQALNGVPFILHGFDKTYLTMPRLLHVLALAYVFANAAGTSPLATIQRENPFAMLGRHSLPIFAVGTMLSLVGQVIIFGTEPQFARDTVLLGGGIVGLFVLAWGLDWWQAATRGPRPQPVAAPAAQPALDPSMIASVKTRRQIS
ncbi:OpgC family protein [Consotaella aegiceratis]|uniref:OpgC family protein n=1 Tax=Consotaella aegiceratis TaxID=3097961 RepID=UPI002F3F5C39